PEYCDGMWRMLQHPSAEDFVLATGETHSVREFVTETFADLGICIEWQGTGPDEKGVVQRIDESVLGDIYGIHDIQIHNGNVVVEIDPTYLRPTEVDTLMGDASKAKNLLGWEAKIRFKELTRIMIAADIKLA
ncbi:MAG TPA: GDP-mannose 4,6-dehydratase, partial [Pyrinomonadaceae bacterium]|nr:GDP-mannose 4,6-dehydratase [Pyrinomonadaceae bacterium]